MASLHRMSFQTAFLAKSTVSGNYVMNMKECCALFKKKKTLAHHNER